MSERLEALFDEFAAAHARGERPHVLAFLERAGEEREELGRLIDAYLQVAPVQPPGEETVAAVRARLAEPGLLRLRRRLGLKRSTVVRSLRMALGLPIAADNRLAARYHELETDLLEPERVHATVWAALREVFGADVRDLVRLPPRPAAAPAPAYFRAADAAAPSPERPPEAPSALASEVDRLFGVVQ